MRLHTLLMISVNISFILIIHCMLEAFTTNVNQMMLPVSLTESVLYHMHGNISCIPSIMYCI